MLSQSNYDNQKAARQAADETREEERREKKLCIYHGNCLDGFAAAWVVRKAFGEKNVEFVAGTYQQDPPDVTDRDVILVDFSYKRDVIKQMMTKCKSLVVIDHHKTAAEDLADLDVEARPGDSTPNLCFDLEKSGAMLAWIFFFGDDEPPALIKYIQDRDLWQFKLPGTREVHMALASHPYDFKVWDLLMNMSIPDLYADGHAIERKHNKDVKELLAVAKRRLVIDGVNVPAASAPYYMASDAGHILGQGEPFSATYYDVADGRVFSLRSAEDGVDVAAVAQKFGGGGHKHAAGFKVSLEVAMSFEVESEWTFTRLLHDSLQLKPAGTYNLSGRVTKNGNGVRLHNLLLLEDPGHG